MAGIFRVRWARVRAWFWRLFHERKPLPSAVDECPHEVEPTDNPDWGRCKVCGDSTFPMTERAAYGDPECKTCRDTGLIPAEPPADRPGAFVDTQCPDCQDASAKDARAICARCRGTGTYGRIAPGGTSYRTLDDGSIQTIMDHWGRPWVATDCGVCGVRGQWWRVIWMNARLWWTTEEPVRWGMPWTWWRWF